jgi:hypothetical protein
VSCSWSAFSRRLSSRLLSCCKTTKSSKRCFLRASNFFELCTATVVPWRVTVPPATQEIMNVATNRKNKFLFFASFGMPREMLRCWHIHFQMAFSLLCSKCQAWRGVNGGNMPLSTFCLYRTCVCVTHDFCSHRSLRKANGWTLLIHVYIFLPFSPTVIYMHKYIITIFSNSYLNALIYYRLFYKPLVYTYVYTHSLLKEVFAIFSKSYLFYLCVLYQ